MSCHENENKSALNQGISTTSDVENSYREQRQTHAAKLEEDLQLDIEMTPSEVDKLKEDMKELELRLDEY